MKRNKKGTDVGASMPGRERTFSNLAQNHLNIISNTCLMLFGAFLILICLGTYTGNESVTILGLGLGASVGLIQARMNLKEDE